MFKKLALMILALAFMAACAGDKTDQTASDITELTIAQLNANTADYVGKMVKITGTVDHVCRHGGKRMFLMGDQPSDRIKIECGDQPPFQAEFEGNDMVVTGTVIEERVDEASLDEMASQIMAEEQEESCPAEQQSQDAAKQISEDDHADHDDPMAQVKALRKQLADSGKDHLSYYHIECATSEEVKAP